jgi:hypothetical protein
MYDAFQTVVNVFAVQTTKFTGAQRPVQRLVSPLFGHGRYDMRALTVNCSGCGGWKGTASPPASDFSLEELGRILRDAWTNGDNIEFSVKGTQAACHCRTPAEKLAKVQSNEPEAKIKEIC